MQKLKSILYVDDDPDICVIVKLTLGLLGGFDVNTACSGAQALEDALALRPDLILMDVMMPALDGPSTLMRMREQPKTAGIPVVFMTAKVLPAEIAYFIELGVVGVIAKPFDPIKLVKDVSLLWDTASSVQIASGASANRSLLTQQVDGLAQSFITRTRNSIPSLRGMVEGALSGDRSRFREIEQLSHSIHGAGAIFGFPEISTLSGAIERLVDVTVVARSPEAPDDTAEPPLQFLFEELVRAVERAEGGFPATAASVH